MLLYCTNKINQINLRRAIDPLIVLRRLDTTIITVLLPARLVGGRYVFPAHLGMGNADE